MPRITLRPRRSLPFFSRHPWVFAGAIDRIEEDPAPGDEVTLFSHEGQFIARGLYNPDSNIRVRLYSWDEGVPLDEAFWSARLDEAIALRKHLFAGDAAESACRMVFSEADGLSGLVVDRYGEFLVVQWTSRALAERRDVILSLLQQKLKPGGIWLRTEKGIGEAEGLAIADGLVSGRQPPRPLFIEENGLRFGVDLAEGQKTGFYFDQRENRAAVARYVRRGRVLDLFCYTGGFSLAAAALGESRHVLAVDSSEPALNIGRANAELNGVSDRIRFERSDVAAKLEELRGAGEKFNVVILDPPKMARTRGGLERALKAYFNLNRQAVDLLEPGGILATCSCSGLVAREDFEQIIAKVAAESRRPIQILESRGAAPDHPISANCLENQYLKCFICRVR